MGKKFFKTLHIRYIVTQFSHYVKIASQPGAHRGGLPYPVGDPAMETCLFSCCMRIPIKHDFQFLHPCSCKAPHDVVGACESELTILGMFTFFMVNLATSMKNMQLSIACGINWKLVCCSRN